MPQIKSRLSPAQRQPLINFFMDNLDVFAWSASDLVGINLEVITYHLADKLTYPLVRKKRRSFAPEHTQVINEEV